MKQNRINEEIFAMLSKKEMHQRKLERALKINQTNIRRSLITLEKDNIVDKREVGKSKVYFVKNSLESRIYSRLVENHKLMEGIKKPKIRKIVSEIYSKITNKKLPFDLVIILFGSYAKNLEEKGSDIDIYINSGSKSHKKEIEEIDNKINVISADINRNRHLFEEIKKNHIILNNLNGFEKLFK